MGLRSQGSQNRPRLHRKNRHQVLHRRSALPHPLQGWPRSQKRRLPLRTFERNRKPEEALATGNPIPERGRLADFCAPMREIPQSPPRAGAWGSDHRFPFLKKLPFQFRSLINREFAADFPCDFKGGGNLCMFTAMAVATLLPRRDVASCVNHFIAGREFRPQWSGKESNLCLLVDLHFLCL